MEKTKKQLEQKRTYDAERWSLQETLKQKEEKIAELQLKLQAKLTDLDFTGATPTKSPTQDYSANDEELKKCAFFN